MLKKPGRSPTLMSGLILCIILSSIAPPTLANQGVNWLTAQAQPSGHYSTANDLDLPFIATAETLHTLYELGETDPSMTAALQAINAVTQLPIGELSTETLAKILIIGAKASQPVDALTTELLTRLNHYGGFGDLIDYDSSVIDTSAALTALAQSQSVDTALETLYPTIDLLLKQQQEDGGWADNGNDSSVYLTAITMHALWHYRHEIKNIPSLNVIPTLDKAQAYLLNELNQGDLDTFEIALALVAILPRLLNQDDILNPLTTLRAAQLANGSWDNDVYTTALALRALHIADSPQSNPDAARLQGIVMDSTNNAPLPAVEIVATFGDSPIHLTTQSDGTFELDNLFELKGELSFTIEGYVALSLDIVMAVGETLDLGQIRLRPEIGDTLLPDLRITHIDPPSHFDPQTLTLSNQIIVDIENAGTAPTSQNIAFLAFHDTDNNGMYQADSEDILLGKAVIEHNLAVDETLSVAIPVAGQLPFRDAPITVVADSRQLIAENKKENNVRSSSVDMCQMNSDIGFEPVIKWEKGNDTGEPYGSTVSHTPIVGPLLDTNGDGLINQDDTPAVIVMYGGFVGPMIALDGKTGEELWRTDIIFTRIWGMTPALGDIDGDGRPEIIALLDKRPIAINNDGTEKWRSEFSTTPVEFMGITLADLDGDGQGEIIAGRMVYNSDGSVKWKDLGGTKVPFVVDLERDGSPEMIMGNFICRTDGRCESKFSSSWLATGDLDDDPYPEIVMIDARSDNLYLFDHDGSIKWGPVNFTFDSRWWTWSGMPSIADMDGDGIMDIGIQAGDYYKVFDGKYGDLKWKMPVRFGDGLGSSVFDFDGDGSAEIV